MNASTLETATLGGGCFWCTEAVFLDVEGVVAVESGYSNGHVERPSYEQVCTGTTGHAEVVRVRFDPQRIGFRELLEIAVDRQHDVLAQAQLPCAISRDFPMRGRLRSGVTAGRL